MTPPQLLTSRRQDWQTPLDLFTKLNGVFKFALDPCTTADNPLGVGHIFTIEDDGLSQRWGVNAFVNPPYLQTRRWIEYACNESTLSHTTVVCLIASRTGTKVWQETIFKFARAVCFMKGRLHFDNHKDPATFDSAIVVFSPSRLNYEQWQALQSLGKTIEF